MERVREKKASRTFPRLKLLKEFTTAAIDVKGAHDGIVLMKEWETESWKVVQCNMPFTEPHQTAHSHNFLTAN